MYLICNENNHYATTPTKNKGYQIVSDIEKAHHWEKLESAQNFLSNNCSQVDKLKIHTWHIIDVSTGEIVEDTPIENIIPVESCNILDTIKEISSFTKKIELRKIYLAEQLRQIEMEIVDIEHAAEFYNLNASQGYKLYKMLHNARVKRRAIKDELQIIGYTLASSLTSNSMDNLESSILGLDNRKYMPRVNKELFGV